MSVETPFRNRNRVPATATRFAAALAILVAATCGAACTSATYTERVSRDQELTRKANVALADAGVDTRRIEAQSYFGVVALLGRADENEVAAARRAVSELPGVVRVNNLVLTEGISSASGFTRADGRKAPLIARDASVPDSK